MKCYENKQGISQLFWSIEKVAAVVLVATATYFISSEKRSKVQILK